MIIAVEYRCSVRVMLTGQAAGLVSPAGAEAYSPGRACLRRHLREILQISTAPAQKGLQALVHPDLKAVSGNEAIHEKRLRKHPLSGSVNGIVSVISEGIGFERAAIPGFEYFGNFPSDDDAFLIFISEFILRPDDKLVFAL
ncbi:MAG: hypothetical protein B6245_04205 [Desulfobacteraceae bacterium 4572_88]|nr:MAG: hypothetical protein B6245_04205 [Desulfobacteraceae bacterium 4572_88]